MLCSEKGVSAEELREVLGFSSVESIYKLWAIDGPKAKAFIGFEKLVLLCEYLDVHVEEIIVWQ